MMCVGQKPLILAYSLENTLKRIDDWCCSLYCVAARPQGMPQLSVNLVEFGLNIKSSTSWFCNFPRSKASNHFCSSSTIPTFQGLLLAATVRMARRNKGSLLHAGKCSRAFPFEPLLQAFSTSHISKSVWSPFFILSDLDWRSLNEAFAIRLRGRSFPLERTCGCHALVQPGGAKSSTMRITTIILLNALLDLSQL